MGEICPVSHLAGEHVLSDVILPISFCGTCKMLAGHIAVL